MLLTQLLLRQVRSCSSTHCRCTHDASRASPASLLSHVIPYRSLTRAMTMRLAIPCTRDGYFQYLSCETISTCWRDNSMYKFRHGTFPHSWRKLPLLVHFLIWHLSVQTSRRLLGGRLLRQRRFLEVRCSCRIFGKSIITVMLSFQVGCLSCTYDQSNSEMVPFGMQGRASHDVSFVIC